MHNTLLADYQKLHILSARIMIEVMAVCSQQVLFSFIIHFYFNHITYPDLLFPALALIIFTLTQCLYSAEYAAYQHPVHLISERRLTFH
jgi:hypothetical protein